MKRTLATLFFLSLASCQPDNQVFPEVCDDSFDNDQNGLADCADDACADAAVCNPTEVCGDLQDNDDNGAEDCEDDACSGTKDCRCNGSAVILNSNLPFSIEGDTAEGVFAVNVLGCQLGETRESFFNFNFEAPSVDILLEPLDDVEMVLQIDESCEEFGTSSACFRNGAGAGAVPLDLQRVDVFGGTKSIFVGAREAGATGRFRITFSLPQ